MKAQGSILSVMVVVIMIGLFISFTHYIRTSGEGRNVKELGISMKGIHSKEVLNSFYGVQYPISMQENEELATVLRYACRYEEVGGKYIISEEVPVIFEAKKFTKDYLEKKKVQGYQMIINCSGRKEAIYLGRKPPENATIWLENKVMLPDPRGGIANVKIKRWM